jgi:hypothetical protein
MYNGTQVGSGSGSGFQTGGIIYLLRGPTTSAVYTAANLTTQVLTAGESYVGSAQRSIKLTTYNAGTTYNLYTHRGTINKITNPVIKGIWEYVINLSYSGNQPASVYVDANFFGDVNTGSTSVISKTYSGADAVGTDFLGVGQDTFTPYWVINKYQFQLIFTTVEIPLVLYRGVNNVFRCTLEDDLETVLYTFPTITRTSAGSGQSSSSESFTFTAPSQQTITQGFLSTAKKLRFRFRLVSGTSSGGFSVFYNQPTAGGVNNLSFKVGSGSYSTPISLNQTNLKALQFDGPLMREYELSVPIEEFDLTLFDNPKFDLKFNFIQPSGTTTNHFIEAFFNDGSLSHCHTALNITNTIPSLRQVMQSAGGGDTDVNMYFFGGAGIQNVSFITDTLGITYSVKAITAGTGINVTSTAQGIYTINTVPAPLAWDNDIKINNGTTGVVQLNPTLTTSLDINNFVYEVQIETWFSQAPPYLMISFNEVFTNLASTMQSRHGFSSTLTRLNNPTTEIVSGEIYINNNASWYCANQGEILIHGYIRPLRSTQNGGSGTNNQNVGVLFHGASWYNRKAHSTNNSPIEAWSHSSFSKIVYATPLIDRVNNPAGNLANINYISLNTDNVACMRSLRIRTRIHSTIDRN